MGEIYKFRSLLILLAHSLKTLQIKNIHGYYTVILPETFFLRILFTTEFLLEEKAVGICELWRRSIVRSRNLSPAVVIISVYILKYKFMALPPNITSLSDLH